VITATDGDSALKVFIETPVPIHLVISDARMPGLKGPQFLQNVRKMSPATATLLISGTQPAPDAGTAWLMKPFRPETLAALIQELLAACDFSRIRREQAALRSSVRTIRGSSSDPPDIVPRSTT
jgi:DNA-binding NtrC family response regulator